MNTKEKPDKIILYEYRGNGIWRLYWFGRNLIGLALYLIFFIPFEIWQFLLTLRLIFVTDGSQIISLPWEWDWTPDR